MPRTSRVRLQLRDLVAERGDQLFLGPLADVWSTKRVYRPMIPLAVSDERTNAHDGVLDVFRKFVAKELTNVRFRLADETVGRCEPAQIGHGLQVPDNDAWLHTS
jgi:hypothetical protein